jgi:hypothetical protein
MFNVDIAAKRRKKHKNQTKIGTWDLFGPILRSGGAWDLEF